MGIEIVYKRDNAWFHGFLSISDIVIYNHRQIHNAKNVKKIDEYEHSSKFNNTTINNSIDTCIKKYSIDELYIKYVLPKEKICSKCTNKCKSDKVIGCNMFTMENRR